MARTAFLTHDIFLDHDTGPTHPECSDRLRAIWHAVDKAEFSDRLVRPLPEPTALDQMSRCHGQAVLDTIVKNCDSTGRRFLDPDTVVSHASLEAACHAVGAGRLAADMIVAGEVENAFCAVRPPGHHATPLQSMGFCVFNNIGLLAKYLQEEHGAERVLIVDWDVHHGNGTQDIFYNDPSVMYCSIHQSPHYPGTGAPDERGAGEGEGATLNLPLPAGAGDELYANLFETIVLPAAESFAPDWVLISAGFDAHVADPLAGMRLTEPGFAALTDCLTGLAERHAGGRMISYLEGGYDLDGLARSVVAHLDRLQAAN